MNSNAAVICFFLFASSEGFFIPASLRKQPDCVRRAPQTTTFNNPQWIPSQTPGNNNGGVNNIQGGYKEYNHYTQQQSQSQIQPQQLQPQQQSQQFYSTQLHNAQGTVPKYEATPYQTPFNYDPSNYNNPLNSYSQSVQLVPCLCPVNKEMIEQQQQQLQQQQIQAQQIPQQQISPTATSLTSDASSSSANQKKN